MKSSNKIINKDSHFSYLLKSYFLFTILILFIISSLVFIVIQAIYNSLDVPNSDPIDQIKILESGQYENLNIKNLVGRHGRLEILNENNHVIFKSSSKDKIKAYTKYEVDAIPNYEGETYDVTAKEYMKDGKKYILITKQNIYNENDEHEGFQILDENLKVVYSGGNFNNKTSYTQKELSYLEGSASEKYNIYKYPFKDSEDNKHTLILKLIDYDEAKISSVIINDIKISVVTFVVIYILCVVVFVTILNRKVKEPLIKLNNAMLSLANGNSKVINDYQGSSEFETIFKSFNQMSLKLKESEKQRKILESEKQKMLADISHDLKTPITIIKGYAKALNDGIIAERDKEKYLKVIYQKSSDLTELINVFYEYNKLEHSKFTFNLQENNLSEFLRAYVAEKYEYIEVVGFEIDVDIPEEKLLCTFDEIELKRVFENIVSNSIKHNEKGTKISFILKEEDNYYKIIIGDNGVGIPKEISENVFDAFVVGDDSRISKQGSGLGLAIAKKIIEKHDGKIRLISCEEFSTAFEMLLPKE